jgi:hypothetical protein
MKKLITLFSCVTLLFAACTSDGEIVESEIASYTGVLETQVDGDDLSGTHVLKLNDGTEVAVRSLKVNLGSSMYEGNMLEVLGAMSEDEVFEIDGLSVLEVMTSAAPEAKLIDYRSSELGFDLKYYNDWTVTEEKDYVLFESGDLGFTVSQMPFNYNEALNEGEYVNTHPVLLHVEWDQPNLVFNEADLHEIGPDRLEALKFDNDSGGSLVYELYRPGLIYKISLTYDWDIDEGEAAEAKRQFADSVQSFRFIGMPDEGEFEDEFAAQVDEEEELTEEPVVIDTGSELPSLDFELATFESLPFHFRGAYPKSWYYAGYRSEDPDIHHFYNFSDEVIEEGFTNQKIRLDIRSNEFVDFNTLKFGELKVKEAVRGEVLSLSTEVNGQHYVLSGAENYRDLMLNMLASIESVERE